MTPNAVTSDALRDALDALARIARGDRLIASAVIGEVLLAQAEQRSAAVSHALIDARMGSHGATDATGEVRIGRPLEVLRHGPRDGAERALVSVLMAQHLGTLLDRDGGVAQVRALLPGLDWLEFTGPYAPYSAARAALAPEALSRLDQLLRAAPVEATSERAGAAVRALRGIADADGAGLLQTVRGPSRPGAGAKGGAAFSLAGELEGVYRGTVARVLSVFTGWSFVRGGFFFAARHALSLRRPVTVTLDGETLRVVGHAELLGRTLRTFDARYPLAELVEVRREARYPALPAALAAVGIALGAILGARAVVEGAGVQYFPLIAIGLGLIAGGLLFDFLLRALFPGIQGMGRLVVRARDARAIVVTRMPLEELDRLLDAIEARFTARR